MCVHESKKITFNELPVFLKVFVNKTEEKRMKKLCLIVLSLGLFMAVSIPAFALDVKFSGEFYAAGMYLDKTTFRKDTASDGPSTAFYYQRLRVQTDFIVSPGLSLVTRFDAMERAWGASRTSPSANLDYVGNYYANSAGTRAENENIAFDLAYIQYASPIGAFTVGYQNDDVWGTVFGDNSTPRGKIGWSMQMGGWTAMAQIVKVLENSRTATYTSNNADRDHDRYIAGVIYHWKGGEAGARYLFNRNAQFKADSYPYGSLINLHSIQPYAKAKLGPVTIQTELNYYWGEEKGQDGGLFWDAKLEAINFYLDASADFNMFYIGGTFAYLSGDHPGTGDKKEGGSYLFYGGATGGGLDWNPCLIMFNADRTYWAGYLAGYADVNGSAMQNAWFGQIRGGIKPLAALNIMASVSYAEAEQKPTFVSNSAYGTEIDLTATYKITNNLSYMLGAGYLFTGDYYKGYSSNNKLNNDFLLINKLTLTF
jgi:hypothetical protein